MKKEILLLYFVRSLYHTLLKAKLTVKTGDGSNLNNSSTPISAISYQHLFLQILVPIWIITKAKSTTLRLCVPGGLGCQSCS